MNIYQLIQKYRTDYKTRDIKIVDGYEFNQYKKLNTIELYYNSRFETGMKDSQGIEKAFYNINKSRVLVETRATDLDTKDIQISADNIDDRTKSMLFSKENKLFMKESRFSVFLNKLGHTASKYGGAVVKKTEQGGKLSLNVIPWKYLTTDQTDILNGIIIEKHYYTPSGLKKMSGIWDNIDEAIETAKNSKAEDNQNGTVQTQGDFIEVWELHGELPESMLYEDGSDDVYVRQMHVVTGLSCNETNVGEYEYSGVTLFNGKEKENPYKYYSREEIPGRALGVGVVEDSEQSQIWTNKAVNEEKKVMELAGKIIFQQQGKGMVKNILTDVDNGTIVDNKGNQITQLSTVPGSLPQFQNLVNMWNTQAERVTSTYASVTGETLPSGTPYRLGAIMNQEANSQFEYLREKLGLFIVEIYTDWVMPYLKKKLQQEHTLTSDFTVDELVTLDESFVSYNVNEKLKQMILSGKTVSQEMIDTLRNQLTSFITETKNVRGLKIPKGYYDNVEFKLDIIVTNEQRIKSVYLETLSNILTTVAQNPAVLTDPKLSQVFNEIMEVAGFSPQRLATITQASSQGNVPPIQTSQQQIAEKSGAVINNQQ